MTTEHSPYEQGFRDALLTMKASLDAYRPGPDTLVLERFDKRLTALIDQNNLDLWNLLAVAQADLSKCPEAEGLRRMLRAPSGLLIDSRGRVLFVRLSGAEYDTGVLALLEENARLTGSGSPLDAEEIQTKAEVIAALLRENESLKLELQTRRGGGL